MSGKEINCKVSFEELIEKLHEIFESDHVNIEEVQQLMESYESNPLDWKKFAKFDSFRYTRNLVDEGNGKFNLMLLCWNEGHASSIHDHANSHCFMKMLSGGLREIRFSWPDRNEDSSNDHSMTRIAENLLKTNQVCYIHDKLGLHRVENVSDKDPAVSLHLYCPPFDQCNTFDEKTGKSMTCKVTFWSKFGNRTPFQQESLPAAASAPSPRRKRTEWEHSTLLWFADMVFHT
ncbi:unnamed protein product [Cyprideis torosa]|uniref:Cysteine dioxygenase n=1 Tax=Cyprideis torosa TaxID=163714 RepID=A0A7R8WCH4_9CRUS|nr:unnamed protein product [Cyprideis torosa]CAG0887529.1 unnamed protein product [Cyprideis torosa]